MNTVVIDGVTYTKASDLAREFRYTTDYIGQLCRAEKVDAQFVGRSWYVSRDSLEQHGSKRISAIRQDEIVLNSNIKIDPVRVSAPLSKNTKRMLSSQFNVSATAGNYSRVKYESDFVDLLPATPIKPTLPKIAITENEIKQFASNATNNLQLNIIKEPQTKTLISPLNNFGHQPKAGVIAIKPVNEPFRANFAKKTFTSQTPVQVIDETKSIPPLGKSISFIPTTVLTASSEKLFPYRMLANFLLVASVCVLLATVLLDVEFRYEGVISTFKLSLDQTALLILFE